MLNEKNKYLGYANLLIHSFAVAHAAVVALFSYFDLPDEVPLTILTVLMIILVVRLYKFPYDLSAVLSLMFCFGGFFLGTKGGELMSNHTTGFWHDYANVIVTFLVTEMVGWVAYLIAKNLHIKQSDN